MLILTVIQGPDKGKKFELPDNEPQMIGRSSESLPLTDTAVSRRHAEMTPDHGQWWIRDLNSQNGTYVNGVRIADRTRMNIGDQIRVGATLFVFGRALAEDSPDVIRVMRPDQMDTSVDRVLASNEDSMVLAEPEPRSAAVHHLRVIYQLTELTSQVTDRNALLEAVMDLVFTEFQPERGFIVLTEGGVEKLLQRPPRPAVVRYASEPRDKKSARIHVSRTILQHAIKGHEGVISSNAMADPRFAAGDSVQGFRIRSAICSPIAFRDETFGAIYVDSSVANFTFTEPQLALMNAIARHTGLALANADAYHKKLQNERLAAIGETVASLSHSIKNILQGLRGGADVVEMGLRKDDLKIAAGGWQILKRNLDRIMALTLNMLAYSRQQTLDLELTRLGPLIEDCAQLLHDQCQAKGVALIVDPDPEMPPVLVDPHLVHQALMNLMLNAVEAVPARTGAVTVRVSYHDAHPTRPPHRPAARIDIIDNGPGIAPERLERIFEPFHTTKGTRGTGLGLAVTKRIVEQHAGVINVRSDPAQGSTFTIVLPADLAAEHADPSATAASRKDSANAAERLAED